jgi:hypothetical protein
VSVLWSLDLLPQPDEKILSISRFPLRLRIQQNFLVDLVHQAIPMQRIARG